MHTYETLPPCPSLSPGYGSVRSEQVILTSSHLTRVPQCDPTAVCLSVLTRRGKAGLGWGETVEGGRTVKSGEALVMVRACGLSDRI